MNASIPQHEIDKLKTQFAQDTRGLAHAVAKRLAMAGERPSGNRVRELTQRGSMVTINKGLQDFWKGISELLRVNIGVPDVPEAVVQAFQTGVKAMWDASIEQATHSFDDEREVFQHQIAEAKAAADSAQQQEQAATAALAAARQEVTATAASLASAQTERDALATNLKANEVTRDRLSAEIADLKATAARTQREHEAALTAAADERRRDREALEGQLAFATRQIDEAREKAKLLAADLDRERKRTERIEREARDDANINRIAREDLQKRLDEARTEVNQSRHALDVAQADRAKALEAAADATARGMMEVERLNVSLRAETKARESTEAALAAVHRLLQRFRERISDDARERGVTAEDPLFGEIEAILAPRQNA